MPAEQKARAVEAHRAYRIIIYRLDPLSDVRNVPEQKARAVEAQPQRSPPTTILPTTSLLPREAAGQYARMCH